MFFYDSENGTKKESRTRQWSECSSDSSEGDYRNESDRFYIHSLSHLKRAFQSPDLTLSLDFTNCGLNINKFERLVNTCLQLFERQPSKIVEVLSFAGCNYIADECTNLFIQLIRALPIGSFFSCIIPVHMDPDNFKQLQCALEEVEQRQKKKYSSSDKIPVFSVDLRNKRKTLLGSSKTMMSC